MAKYMKKPVVVEAITFDELVEYGLKNTVSIVNGIPWSFTYNGVPITHENDDCYLITTLEGTMRFNRGDMLIIGVKGELYPCKPDIFEITYEPVDESVAMAAAMDSLINPLALVEMVMNKDAEHEWNSDPEGTAQ